MKIIKGKNFILRPFRMSDAKSVVKHINDKEVSQFLKRVPHPYFLKDAKKWLRKKIRDYSKKDPKEIVFAIEIENEVVGGIGVNDIEKGHKAEIGYWLGKKFWGKGIMTKVVREILKYCFQELGLFRVEAYAFSKNRASARVLEKNSLKLEGFSRKRIKKGNKFYDVYFFAKIK